MQEGRAVRRDIIVIGASAGGIEALKEIVRGLPKDLQAAIFVVVHTSPASPNMIPAILGNAGVLPAVSVKNKDTIRHGYIYVARPNYHILLESGIVRAAYGPKENRHRPAIDPLFRSAAYAYDSRVVGVVLTGSLDDGTIGSQIIKSCGGIVVVQEPNDATFPCMPRSVVENVKVDYCLPLLQISPLLIHLVNTSVEKKVRDTIPDDKKKASLEIMQMKGNSIDNIEELGKPSAFICPECNGGLYELHEGELIHYRCKVGHAYSPLILGMEQSEKIESALWAALRLLKENVDLNHKLALKARERNDNLTAVRFEENAHDANQHAEVLQQILIKRGKPEES